MKHFVITIARQYGSGGRAIGKKIAEQLGVKFYDNELVDSLSEKLGVPGEIIGNIEESKTKLPYMIDTKYGSKNVNMLDKMIHEQSNIISALADKDESCVIVGRCADYVLRNRKDTLNVYVYASEQARLERLAASHSWTPEQAGHILYQTEHQRKAYYKHVTGQEQDTCENRHIMLDSGMIGDELAAGLVIKTAQEIFAGA